MDNENKQLNTQSETTTDTPEKKVHTFHAVNGILRLIFNIVALFFLSLAYSMILSANSGDNALAEAILALFYIVFAVLGGILFIVALILTIIAIIRLVGILKRKEKLSVATIVMDIAIIVLTVVNVVLLTLVAIAIF